MKTTLEILLLLLVLGLPLQLFYWKLFHPVLLNRLRNRIDAAKDDLRIAAASGDAERNRAFEMVSEMAEKAKTHLEQYGLVELLFTRVNRAELLETERDLKLIRQSDPVVNKAFHEIMLAVAGAACANSPGALITLVPPLVALVVMAIWFYKTRMWFRERMELAVRCVMQPA